MSPGSVRWLFPNLEGFRGGKPPEEAPGECKAATPKGHDKPIGPIMSFTHEGQNPRIKTLAKERRPLGRQMCPDRKPSREWIVPNCS